MVVWMDYLACLSFYFKNISQEDTKTFNT